MHSEPLKMRAQHEQASKGWESERTKLSTSIVSFTQGNEAMRDNLGMMTKERDEESQGYRDRIAELERWGSKDGTGWEIAAS
ncbi:hypothetical protein RSAG8_04307, partial [Rhizoctonia solani AG-8 WAC10335]